MDIRTSTLFAVIAVCCLIQTVHGATYTVGPTGADFSDIQSAIDSAAAGDTLLISDGTYHETIRIAKPIILKGASADGAASVIDATMRGNAVEITADGVRIEGLVIRNGGAFDGISVSSRDAVIERNTITGNGRGIVLNSADSATISGNTISSNSIAGVLMAQSRAAIITANTISSSTGTGLIIEGGAEDALIYLNTFRNPENAFAGTTASWNSPQSIAYPYGGKTYSLPLGNFWSDYTGRDDNNDNVGDSPYTIERSKETGPSKTVPATSRRDRYPLMQPYEAYTGTPATPGQGTTLTPTPTPGIPTQQPTESVPPTTTPAGSSPTPPAETSPKGGSGDPVRMAFTFLGILLVSAVVLATVLRRDLTAASPHTYRHPPPLSSIVPAAYGIMGLILLAAPLLILSDTDAWGAVAACAPMIYIALSSFALSYGTIADTPFILTSRIHIATTALAGSLMILLIASNSLKGGPAFLLMAAVPFISLGLSIWQYRGIQVHDPKSVQATAASTLIGVPETTGPEINHTSAHPPALQTRYFPAELQSKYFDIEYIGKGGIARVFRARRRSDSRLVAIKTPISFDEITGISFLKEIRAWEELHHPNIVEVLDGNILPLPYFEMEYLPHSLQEMKKPVDLNCAVRIVQGIASGLAYAHKRGVIHRDLKPHNILFAEVKVPKIADWGLSKDADESKVSSIAGFSLAYAAPEQVSPREFGRTDARTDIYQLGVIFYELVTGRLPFEGEGIAEIASSIIRDRPVPPSQLNPAAGPVEGIIVKCLAKEQKERYQSVEAVQKELFSISLI